MRKTSPLVVLLWGLGTTFHCGTTTSPLGSMNVVNDGQGCAPVGSMSKASDGCNACTCAQSGQWACTTVACGAPDGRADSGGDASDVTCGDNGRSYHPGD